VHLLGTHTEELHLPPLVRDTLDQLLLHDLTAAAEGDLIQVGLSLELYLMELTLTHLPHYHQFVITYHLGIY
jgi:hypothetical protein